MLSLVVNGDDFGKSEDVNDAILKSFQNGILRSTSLMANGKSFTEAVKIIKSNPELDVGVHLTLTEEKPILNNDKLPSLTDEHGYFLKHALYFSKKYFSGRISIEEVRIELIAQFEKILDYGIKITHIDSHQHLHILPKIHDIIIELAHHYNIKFIRFPKEKFSNYMFRNLNIGDRILQMAVLNCICSRTKKKNFNKTDYFTGFYFGGKLNKQNLITLIHNLPSDGVCELMCHPGLVNSYIDHSPSSYRQVEETLALVDLEVAELLKQKNIMITSFNNLD
jgi:hopanoid biosynthesis associated protein HpnK